MEDEGRPSAKSSYLVYLDINFSTVESPLSIVLKHHYESSDSFYRQIPQSLVSSF
jgi:hypothetical protein